ncbi:signal peptidase II [Lachnospiraceae bacterium JLR.KK008]
MKKQKKRLLLKDVLGMFLLIMADQLTKYIAVVHLKDKPAISIIPDVLELSYLENRGAAFGMLQNQKIFFVFVAVIILAVIGYVLFKMPEKKKYAALHVLLVLIASGAVGNLIDRLRLDYVVDFISFVLIHFPIFNVADIYVTVATTILVLLLLFYYKEEDLNFMSFKQTKYRELK